MSMSPEAAIFRSNNPWREKSSSMWLKNGMEVSIS